MIQKWPAWHPEQELKAEHLVALEDYLLSRVLITDHGAWGIVALEDWERCIQVELSGTGLIVRVNQVRGVTPAGYYVWLWLPEEWLESKIESIDSNGAFDVWIAVNSREKDAPKLAARVVSVPAVEENSRVLPNDTPAELYLGRYRVRPVGPETRVELLHRPVPRAFTGFGLPTQESWRQWVRPLQDRLDAVARDFASQPPRTPGQVAASVELASLAFDWPALTIPVLARRLRLIEWLRTRPEGTTADPIVSCSPFEWTEIPGDKLPTALARLLGGKEVEQAGASEFSFLTQLLVLRGVHFHAPLQAFKEWSDALISPSAAERRATLSREADAFLQRSNTAASTWAHAVALITARANPGVASNSAGSVCDALEALFRAEARTARAGPLAFFWLARAAWNDPEVRVLAGPELQAYSRLIPQASIVLGQSAPLRGPGRMPDLDRVSAFPLRRADPAGEGTRPFAWSADIADRSADFSGREFRVAVVGSPSSGKSALVRALAEVCRRQYSGVVSEGTVAVDQSGPLQAAVETRCRVTLEGQSQQLTISEAPGDALLPRHSPVRGDLFLLTMDPTAVERGDLAGQVDFVGRLLDQNTSARIAMVYTKSDEYGVMDDQSIRLISQGDATALQAYRLQGDEGAWEQFVRAGALERSAVRREGIASFSRNSRSLGIEAEWLPTRSWVLRQTRSLWQLALKSRSNRFLNGYFVSAESHDALLSDPACSGAAHLLTDILFLVRPAPLGVVAAPDPRATPRRRLDGDRGL